MAGRSRTEPFGGDLLIRAEGDDLAEAFATAVLALGQVLAEGPREESKRRTLALEGADRESLLVEVLEDVLYHFETGGELPAGVEVEFASPRKLRATIRSDTFDPDRHQLGLAVKAVTWHRLEVHDNPPELAFVVDL